MSEDNKSFQADYEEHTLCSWRAVPVTLDPSGTIIVFNRREIGVLKAACFFQLRFFRDDILEQGGWLTPSLQAAYIISHL